MKEFFSLVSCIFHSLKSFYLVSVDLQSREAKLQGFGASDRDKRGHSLPVGSI